MAEAERLLTSLLTAIDLRKTNSSPFRLKILPAGGPLLLRMTKRLPTMSAPQPGAQPKLPPKLSPLRNLPLRPQLLRLNLRPRNLPLSRKAHRRLGLACYDNRPLRNLYRSRKRHLRRSPPKFLSFHPSNLQFPNPNLSLQLRSRLRKSSSRPLLRNPLRSSNPKSLSPLPKMT